jgi:hypothetical protein
VRADAIIESFQYYLGQEGTTAGRAEFAAILRAHLADPGFCSDMEQLLRVGVVYDAHTAGEYVETRVLRLLPEE